MNTFEFTGKFQQIKDSEKLKSYEEKTFDSGWMNRQFNANLVCGSNRHLVTVSGGRWKDDSKSVIHTFTKDTYDKSGNVEKGTRLDVSFADRAKPEIIEQISEYRLFVLDTCNDATRRALNNHLKQIKAGTATEEYKTKYNASTEQEALAAIEAANNAKHKYLSAWDFAKVMQAFVSNEKYKDMLFTVRGTINYSQNPTTGIFYTSYNIQSVSYAGTDAEPKSNANILMYYTDGGFAVDPTTGDASITGYSLERESHYDGNIGVPITVRVPKGDKPGFINHMAKYFTAEPGAYREVKIRAEIIDGAQRMEITYDMLDDEYKANIDFGLCTLEDVIKELGGGMYGERERYIKFTGLADKYCRMSAETVYTDETFTTFTPKGKPAAAAASVDDIIDSMFDDDIVI